MNTCTRSISDDCDGADVRPVLLYLRHTPRMVCATCRAFMESHGISFTEVERRAEDRPFQPVWLRNLRAKDMTDRVA
jgi:hypothetical protein